MKLMLIIMLMLICFNSWLNAITHHIKQDGTGNFTTIQEGIDAAADSDTVLVYPGTYFENIDYIGKSLTVASLYIISPEDSLIDQTIIDGSEITHCVKIDECSNISIVGFTIQNGRAIGGSYFGSGGGILIMDTTIGIISNCKIKNNTANGGGGIRIGNSDIELKSNIISHNRAIISGGGLRLGGNTIQFSTDELNSIYLNYSSTGSDIYIYPPSITYDIIVDTFTVTEPEDFFIVSSGEYSFSCLNHKIDQIDQDLYVAPDGSDENSGLTADYPLQTIAWAQTIIKSNDEYPHTIFLAPGTYSPSLNEQVFPVGIKDWTAYIGDSPETTILDAENGYSIFRSSRYAEDELPQLQIEGVKLINASHPEESYSAIKTAETNLTLKNIIIEDCYGDVGSAILCRDGIYDFQNLIIRNNNGGKAIRISCLTNSTDPILQINMENVLIQNNYPGQGFGAGSGGGVHIRGHHEIVGDYYLRMLNCDINSNYNNLSGGTSGLFLSNFLTADIINCTFAENALSDLNGAVISSFGADINIYNSILYNNYGYSFIVSSDETINVSHSLIEGGDGNVYYNNNGAVNWLEGNFDEDPFWVNTGDHPFQLATGSPCIDAGTLDLPPGIELPEFDLAGNPRIYGDTIDMGAYEWQGVKAEEDVIPILNETRISNYPNPFNPTTTIKLELAESGNIELDIYNIKGQKVKTLLYCTTALGTYNCIWSGKDEIGKPVSSGQYVVKLKQNGKETATKIMMLK